MAITKKSLKKSPKMEKPFSILKGFIVFQEGIIKKYIWIDMHWYFFLILKIMGNNYVFLERKDKFLTQVNAC